MDSAHGNVRKRTNLFPFSGQGLENEGFNFRRPGSPGVPRRSFPGRFPGRRHQIV